MFWVLLILACFCFAAGVEGLYKGFGQRIHHFPDDQPRVRRAIKSVILLTAGVLIFLLALYFA